MMSLIGLRIIWQLILKWRQCRNIFRTNNYTLVLLLEVNAVMAHMLVLLKEWGFECYT